MTNIDAGLIRTINDADRAAILYQEGRATALGAQQIMLGLGFYNVVFQGQKVTGEYAGVAYKLGRPYAIDARA